MRRLYAGMAGEAGRRRDEKIAQIVAALDEMSRRLRQCDDTLAHLNQAAGEVSRCQEQRDSTVAHLNEVIEEMSRHLVQRDAMLTHLKEAVGEIRNDALERYSRTLDEVSHCLARHDWMLAEGLRTVLFLHIPKTAGTSFKLALRDCLPAGRLMFDVSGAPNHEVVESLFAMAPERRARLKVIGAHVPYGLHELFPGAGYVTLLREPIERVLSTYYFAKSRTEFRWSQLIADGMTIEEFAEDVFNDNAQVRRLMKYSDIARADVFEHPPAGKLTRVHLDDAKDTLRRCAVVGVTERYEMFLDQVSAAFGLPPLPVRTDNITSIAWREQHIPNRTIDRLREINQFDAELYAYAQGLLAQRAVRPTAHPNVSAGNQP